MPITLTCSCGKSLEVANDLGGTCPVCGAMVTAHDVKPSTTAIQEHATPATASADVAVTNAKPKKRPEVGEREGPDIDIRLRNHAQGWIKPGLVLAGFLLLLAVAYFMILTPPADSGIRHDTALAQVKGPLASACNTYRIKNEHFPESLQILLHKDKFGMIYIDDPNALIDPWNRPYRYDPKGPKNKGVKPDIWTVAPDGQEIGNWPKKQ